MVSTAATQNPIEAAASPHQQQMNTAGQQLQERAIQYIVEGKLSREHITQDLSASKENLTEQARAKINQMNLNLTPSSFNRRQQRS